MIGLDRWLVYETAAGRLRLRLHAASGAVASWTLELSVGAVSLRQAAAAVGLWPAAAPDEVAESVTAPLIRRPLLTSSGETFSLTASVRGGLFTSLGVFDEEPDWLNPAP
ncbi:MAG: hypothetical protein ABFS14_04165 [Gemmatimonadota bacterium]